MSWVNQFGTQKMVLGTQKVHKKYHFENRVEPYSRKGCSDLVHKVHKIYKHYLKNILVYTTIECATGHV